VLVRNVNELLAAKSSAITIACILVWLTFTQSTGMGANEEIKKLVLVEK